MSAVEAASVRVATMADGTLRLTVDIEPMNAQEAFRLFASPGTRVALAALHPVKLSTEPEKPKGGELCKRAVMLCKDPEFRQWIADMCDFEGSVSEGGAADWIRGQCEIESRSELDHNKVAEERFRALVLVPWAKHRAASAAV